MTVVSRVLALVVAVGLVVGAVVLRQGREEGDGDLGPRTDPDAPLAVSCPTEWRALCGDILLPTEVRTETASAESIAGRLGGDDLVTAIVPTSWADVVDDARSRSGRAPLARSEVVARTPLLMAAFADRATVLAAACGIEVEALGWGCVGEHAGERWQDLGGDVRWGTVVPGHLPPTTATGLLATASVVGARTGTPFSLNDLRDVGFTSWFGQVERAVDSFRPAGGSHLRAMVTRGPSAANVATATEAELATRDLETAFGTIVVAVPEPLHEVELVVVGTEDRDVDTITGRIDRGALAALGWRTSEAPPTGSPAPDLPAVTPAPTGGVLTAVRDVWDDVAG